MNDRELLELAAKAAGIGPIIRFEDGGLLIGPNRHSRYWNPRSHNGDSLLLAAKLELEVSIWFGFQEVRCENYSGAIRGIADFTDDRAYDYRLAIVRAAAEIGRAMP